MNSQKLFSEMVQLLQRGESFAVVTVFDNIGSAPRTDGAKMIVRANGISGSIGGGRLEAENIRLAEEALSRKHSLMHAFDLTSNDASGSDMICGGTGEVLIDSVDAADENNIAVFRAAAEVFERGEKAWLVTILDQAPDGKVLKAQRCLVKPDKTFVGNLDCDPYMLEKLIAGPAKISIHAEVIDNQRFLVEPLRPAGTVYIFGAGHVSQRIAPLSNSVGFKTIVLDDREEYANRNRFPEPTEVMVIDSFAAMPELPMDESSYLVIVTRGHLFDKIVLQQVLQRNVAYIGMIGSRSKRDKVFDELVSNGCTREQLARVHAPIGTDIGAETPEELGVSIVGELIKVRAEHEKGEKRARSTTASCCRIITPGPKL